MVVFMTFANLAIGNVNTYAETYEKNYSDEAFELDNEVNFLANTTLAQLQSKFPSGMYWNHEGSATNNPDGYTSTPCSHHGNCSRGGTDYSGWCGCNSFGSAIQCFGFAQKLSYDYYGSYYTSWSTTSLSNLKAGDVIRYKNDGHSIWVTSVSGDTITFADCNSDGHCLIRWGAVMSKSDIWGLTAVYSAPYELSNDGGNNVTVALDSPSEGANISDDTFRIIGWVKSSSVSRVTFSVNGGAEHNLSTYWRSDVSGTGFLGDLPSYQYLTYDANSIRIKAYFSDGSAQIVGTRTVVRYAAFALDSPQENTTISSSTFQINGWAYFNYSGCAID